MTKAGHTLGELGDTLSESALLSFVANLPAESATAKAINPDAQWTLIPMLLARISDDLQTFIWLYSCAHASKGRRPRQPEPIPRPGVRSNRRRIGKGSLPIKDFDKWYGGD